MGGGLLLVRRGGVSTPLHGMAFSGKSKLCNYMHAAGKIFVKTYPQAIIPFFPVCGISKYVIFLYNRRGKVKLLDFQ